MNSEFQINARREVALADALLTAERCIALVTRCRPINMEAEAKRLLVDWNAGVVSEPRFRYAARQDFDGLRAHLHAIERSLEVNPWRDLYCARIAEMQLESRLVEAVGTPRVVELSRQRYQEPWPQEAARALADEWRRSVAPSAGELVISDDLGDARSLVRRVQAWVGRERLPFRVEVSTELVSLAATGEGFIVVAAGRKISTEDAERVAVHEVLGHALPRVRARGEAVGLFTAGSAEGNDTQEGYAVFCEQQRGVLHGGRRFELALRHAACLCVWDGMSFGDTVERLFGYGAPCEQALRICLRAYRGGGLAREGAYLPSFCAVTSAVARAPELIAWLAAGRLGLPAIARLQEGGHALA